MKRLESKTSPAKSLGVYWEQELAGTLWLDERRRFIFKYSSKWLQKRDAVPISLSLPLRAVAYEEDQSRPFFANLLPEAQIRRAVTQELGISEGNEFGLLEAIGGECAGAVSLWPEGEVPAGQGDYELITHAELEKMVRKMPERPLIMGPHEGLRLSLAGAQSKIPVFIKDNEFFLPRGTYSSSHILKPPISGFKGSVENEAYCMALAAHLDLGVPESFVIPGKICLYGVVRYDREPIAPSGKNKVPALLKRLHQEDFCQSFGILPEAKYEAEGGPTLTRCFRLLEAYSSRPLSDRMRLLRWVAFNHLIGNADAHAKNLSLLFMKGEIVLAPFYDLMCTRIYPRLTPNAAMRIGGETRLDWIFRRNWEQQAESAGIKSKLFIENVADMAEKMPSAVETVSKAFKANHWDHPVVKQISQMIRLRCSKALKRLQSQ